MDNHQYLCLYCGKTYTTSSNLSRHINAAHLQAKFICKTCNKNYKRSDYLLNHVKQHHSAATVIPTTSTPTNTTEHNTPILKTVATQTDILPEGLTIEELLTELSESQTSASDFEDLPPEFFPPSALALL